LGDGLHTLGSLFKSTEVAKTRGYFFPRKNIFLTKKELGYTMGYFLQSHLVTLYNLGILLGRHQHRHRVEEDQVQVRGPEERP
jgi:hypothetical protein